MALTPSPGHPPTAIFRPPLGLQDFLGTKAVGLNPDRLQDLVVPNIAMYPFYLAQIPVQVTSGTSTALNTVGDDIEIARVPAGEIWLVQSIYVETTANDGTSGIVCCGYVAPPGGSIVFTTPYPSSGSATNTASAISFSVQPSSYEWGMQPLVCPTDWSFGLTVARLQVAIGTVVGRFRIAYRVLTV